MLKVLDRIAVALEKGTASDDVGVEVHVNDSMGSCPECDSLEVQQKGNYPKAIYRCGSCGFIWTNDAQAMFE